MGRQRVCEIRREGPHRGGGEHAARRADTTLDGAECPAASSDPEQNVLLPSPVPIYLTYLTAQVQNGQLSYLDDIYGRDTQVAALR